MARRRSTPTHREPQSNAPWPSAQQILDSGGPFIPFSTYSILDWHGSTDSAASTERPAFSQWLRDRLQEGRPVMVKDFHKLVEWDPNIFNLGSLIDLSTDKPIYIRSCGNGRGQTCTLKNFVGATRSDNHSLPNLYARDLPCPQRWMDQSNKVIPAELQWGGPTDLFQWLPQHARSEVMMAYIGSRGSYSGFHRCFGATVVLNLLVEAEGYFLSSLELLCDRYQLTVRLLSSENVLCFGTDQASQAKYDAFMDARGISSHTDWTNITPDQLEAADFPIYVQEQTVGDLVIFPPATAHQVWNIAPISAKLVWNILHPLSIEVGLDYVQPSYNRLCHPDIARTNLSLACAVLSLTSKDTLRTLPPELPLLVRLFRQLVEIEAIDGEPATSVKLVCLPYASVAECNFCGTAIWNRHVQCTECKDFDVCLYCFVGGRSCEHTSSYVWAEIVPVETWQLAFSRAKEALGSVEEPRQPNSNEERSLGTCVNEQLRLRASGKTRLCHLCRIEHPEWKGRPCGMCSAFFCYRGLYRHFDIPTLTIARLSSSWACPKCREICNCRCCHFKNPYVTRPKPPKKQRIASTDPRGKTLGFMDNVFDQRRQSESLGVLAKGNKRATSTLILPTSNTGSQKRSSSPSMDVIGRNLRHGNNFTRENGQIPPFVTKEPAVDRPGPQTSSSERLVSNRNNVQAPIRHLERYDSNQESRDANSSRSIPGVLQKSAAFGASQRVTPGAGWQPQSSLTAENGQPRFEQHVPVNGRSVTQLEQQIERLRKYAHELFELSLHESRTKLMEELTDLENQLKRKKTEKSNDLINKLESDFPALAEITKKEMERLGYLG